MRRLPVLPTILVAAAVALMIGLGIWQMQRAAWKDRLLVEYARAATLPPVDLDPLLDEEGPVPQLAFRRALVTCRAENAEPEIRAGRSRADLPGQVYVVPCRPGASGLAGRLRVNAGWADRPDAARRLTVNGLVAGQIGSAEKEGPIVLTAATAVPPLQPSMPLTIESIPNNHRAYVFTWFAFALIAVVIYVLALRRRYAPRLPPEP
jgi:cytochrome oxidase assembly protein ShyY1